MSPLRLIDNDRWDRLEAEVRNPGPLPLGREATGTMMRFDKTWTDFQPGELATFLFTTREGGRGVVQVFPKDPDVDRTRIRYRMWTTAQAEPTARVVADTGRTNPARTPFGRTVTTTLESLSAGRECLLDLETGGKVTPPDFLLPHEMANPYSLARHERFVRWCRDRGPDLLGRITSVEREARPAGPAGVLKAPAAARPRAELTGLEMTADRILPQSFDDLTVEEARELLERSPNQKQPAAWINSADHLTERPDTFAFRTREGTLGLLQFHVDPKDPGKLTIRYRLERRDGPTGR